jgi:hypothetical protein
MLETVQKKEEEARTLIKGESPEERDTQAAARAIEREELMILAYLGQTHEVLWTDLRAKHQS